MFRRGVVLICLLLFAQPVLAQNQFGVIDYLTDETGEKLYKFIRGDKIFDSCAEEKKYLTSIPEILFDNIYDHSLADILILVDDSLNVKQPILVKDSTFTRNLYGARDVWVVILALDSNLSKTKLDTSYVREVTGTIKTPEELKLLQPAEKESSKVKSTENGKATKDSTDINSTYLNKYTFPFEIKDTYKISSSKKQVVAKISPLDFRLGSEEFIFASVVRSLGNLFAKGSIGTGTQSKRPEDKEVIVELKPIWDNRLKKEKNKKIYMGMVKFNLHENTLNRVKVSFPDIMNKGKQSAFANFGNYSSSYLAVSIGVGMTVNAEAGNKITSADGDATVISREISDADHYLEFSGYIFGHVYLKRPMLPKPKLPEDDKRSSAGKLFASCSYSFVLGTKIEKNLFDNYFYGMGMGHIIGKLGLIAGVSVRHVEEKTKVFVRSIEQTDDPEGESTDRDSRFMIALTYTL